MTDAYDDGKRPKWFAGAAGRDVTLVSRLVSPHGPFPITADPVQGLSAILDAVEAKTLRDFFFFFFFFLCYVFSCPERRFFWKLFFFFFALEAAGTCGLPPPGHHTFLFAMNLFFFLFFCDE
jgi:hypothetical protein